jgi:hypothetical protein
LGRRKGKGVMKRMAVPAVERNQGYLMKREVWRGSIDR